MRPVAPSVAQFGTTKHPGSFDRVGKWRRSRPRSGVYEDPVQDAYSAVSADTNVTRWPIVSRNSSAFHAMRALQCTHCMYGMRDQNTSQRVRHMQ